MGDGIRTRSSGKLKPRFLSTVLPGSTSSCAVGKWLVQTASGDDFVDSDMGYFELKGVFVAKWLLCLTESLDMLYDVMHCAVFAMKGVYRCWIIAG